MSSLRKVLIISGPTATGKTALAVEMAKRFNGELISADSRQVYQEVKIGVGKDHPKNTTIHLIDLIATNEVFSVAKFQKLAFGAIEDIGARGKLPIIVGGTGLYIDAIINPKYRTFEIKPNRFLRLILNNLPLRALQQILKLADNKTYRQLNNSDVNNPRRLIRKIEIKLAGEKNARLRNSDFDVLHLSLTAKNSVLYDRIDERVEERMKMGHLDELDRLIKRYDWNCPGLQAWAYQSFKNRYLGEETMTEAMEKWKRHEHGLARRQNTWFRKRGGKLIDISQKDYQRKAMTAVEKWYNEP